MATWVVASWTLKLELASAGVGALMSSEPSATATVEIRNGTRNRSCLVADLDVGDQQLGGRLPCVSARQGVLVRYVILEPINGKVTLRSLQERENRSGARSVGRRASRRCMGSQRPPF
jgi:hypothetical protein